MIQITIEGNPIPKARARVVRRGGLSISYDPKEKEKENVQKKMIDESNKEFFGKKGEIDHKPSNLAMAEFLDVDIEFHMPIPKSFSNSKRIRIKGTFHNKKPDGSNLFKFYEDCANGILFKDDSKIVKASFKKVYSENPKTIITVKELKNCL